MANVLLDHGAQISLISRKLATRLQLIPVGHQPICISGLNGSQNVPDPPAHHEIVEFQLVTHNGKHTIKAAARDTNAIIGTIYHPPLSSNDLAVIESTLSSVPNHFRAYELAIASTKR
ncbi:hypothetical protein PRIPAC_90105 [Pristionchus pacificus]|uniref:Uncharacterized protein n=1 Tax=Pristionchus pacificus TaxID=54126 RepID=A0A2A6CWW4_PRIPA|nr:hypothetical protein PRIPAC_90105 [Pristionchus pacificus]|eukprot:PDM82580.1 hypothetical protein PRIPAC_36973 [Pristionchus pacificus]